ncbi:MAG: zinc ribbon domain-containing protein YjdM [Kangiellaceae bacterium]|jgi:protein PhnA|nr:zinc ribbon domain-containing protein YjdM [Kangiellaceae bacterium]
MNDSKIPNCPECNSEYVYLDNSQFVCPECGYEWSSLEPDQDSFVVRDSNGNKLQQGDKVTLIKDLKVKGSSLTLKVGTKALVKRVIDAADHQLDCKIKGASDMMITAKFVKKVNE